MVLISFFKLNVPFCWRNKHNIYHNWPSKKIYTKKIIIHCWQSDGRFILFLECQYYFYKRKSYLSQLIFAKKMKKKSVFFVTGNLIDVSSPLLKYQNSKSFIKCECDRNTLDLQVCSNEGGRQLTTSRAFYFPYLWALY